MESHAALVSRSSRKAPRPVVGLIATLGALLLVATLTGVIGSSASAAMRPAAYERGVAAKVNALRTAAERAPLRPGARAAVCQQRAADRAALRLARTGRLPSRVAGSCPSPVVRVVGVRARSPRAAARVALRRPVVRRAVLADGTRTISVGTRRKRDGVWVTVIVLGGRRPAASAPAPAFDPVYVDPSSEAGLMRGEVVADTNAARGSSGLAALTTHACLAANAQRWAETLAASGVLAHQELPTIWEACGQSDRLGENVAYRSDADGSAMVAQWMGSPGHRANILNGSFTRIGVGVAQGEDGRWYGVQVFSDDFW